MIEVDWEQAFGYSEDGWYEYSHLHLTPIEGEILTALITGEGQLVKHRELVKVSWPGYSQEEAGYSLRAYIYRLRKKGVIIKTHFGIGYSYDGVKA